MRRQEHVLDRRGTIDHPVALGLLQAQVAADKDRQRGLPGHGSVGHECGDLREDRLVVDRDELPGLLVAGGGGLHRGGQELLDQLFGHGLVEVRADTAAGADGFRTSITFLLELVECSLPSPAGCRSGARADRLPGKPRLPPRPAGPTACAGKDGCPRRP